MDTVYLFFENENVKIPLTDYDKALFSKLLKSRMGNWEKSERQFCISRSSYDENRMETILSGKTFVEVGKEADNSVVVHSFISGEESEAETSTAMPEANPVPDTCLKFDINAPVTTLDDQFPDTCRNQLEIELHSRDYSPKTKQAYIYYNIELCRWLQKRPKDVNNNDIKRYLAYLQRDKKHSAATLNLNLSAFKFFYHIVLNKNFVTEQKRPRQDKNLPIVLSRSEVKRIIEREPNTKHRILLTIVFASGLRVGEAVNLRLRDVDFDRKVIRVDKGKGRKDRDTLMSQTVKELLPMYITQYNITDWLFPGANPQKHLSIRSAQHIFENALKRAKIEKTASIHCLRHTFATHLLEDGVDITYIKELMGHNSIVTTVRYTKVARRKTLKLTSPMDRLDEGD